VLNPCRRATSSINCWPAGVSFRMVIHS
jgi:hypothetical protein